LNIKIHDVEELVDMVVHPEFRRSMTAQRLQELHGSVSPSRRIVRRHVGLWLVAAGSRLAAGRTHPVHPAAR
jgi:hypothetical protein